MMTCPSCNGAMARNEPAKSWHCPACGVFAVDSTLGSVTTLQPPQLPTIRRGDAVRVRQSRQDAIVDDIWVESGLARLSVRVWERGEQRSLDLSPTDVERP